MPRFEVTFMFGFNGTGRERPGFAEKHVYMPLVSDAEAVAADAVRLCNMRTSLNSFNVDTLQVRISNLEQPRRVKNLFTTGNERTLELFAVGTVPSPNGSDLPHTCLMLELPNAARQASRLYMAGIPDAITKVSPAGPDYGAVAGFATAYDNWKKEITSGKWGFRARLDEERSDIYTWFNEAASPFRLILSVLPTATFDAELGDVIQVRGARMDPRGIPSVNGKWRVAAKAAAGGIRSYTLQDSAAVDSTRVQAYGTVENVAYTYTAYDGAQVVKQGRRKRGVGPIRPVGRVKRRLYHTV